MSFREAPYGRVLTAMVTPMTGDGGVDLDGAARLATHLVDDGGCDGLVISGTTGEAPTTTDAEKESLLRSVVEAVGDRASVLAGIGTNDTAHSVELSRQAEKAGAHALLAVTPYYSRPPQAGLLSHFTQIADATDLPVMLYDIPARSGVPIDTETLVRLADHPRITSLKDAKGDNAATASVIARTDLSVYSGDDVLTLPLLAVGAVGVVGVITHVAGNQMKRLVEAFLAGDIDTARQVHHQLLPVYTGMFRTQGLILAKAALRCLGLPAGPVRAPLVDATDEQLEQLRRDLSEGGITLP
jgi:4-hydroxy-tetrahydrodipicolinate synthase